MRTSEFVELMRLYKQGYTHTMSNSEIVSASEFFLGCAYPDWANKYGVVTDVQACYMLGYQGMQLNGEWDIEEVNRCHQYWKHITLAPYVPRK
jgi:hypothetical protein